MFGVVREDATSADGSGIYIGSILNTFGIDFRARAYTGTSATSSSGSELFDKTDFDTGDIGLLCFDIDNGKLWFGRRDVSGSSTIWYDSSGNNNGDPSAGSNPTYTGTYTGHTWFIGCHDYNGTTIVANFGQDGSFAGSLTSQGASDAGGIGDFNYIESGFLALCTSNMPDITIGPGQDSQADDHFNTVLYTGNGSTQNITGVGFQPDWTWIKNRAATDAHALTDSVRGVTKEIQTNALSAESTNADGLTAFGADGFSLGDDDIYNTNAEGYVSWNWKAGTSFSNDASATSVGTIDSTGTVNTDAGFAIISYTGTGSAGTIAHGLGTVPKFYVVKNRGDSGTNWQAYHGAAASDPETDYLYLNSSAALDDADDWNDTAPTSSVFSVKTHNQVNESGDTYIAYLFSEIEGYSKFGSYVGNGNANGMFVYTGFRPAWIMVKEVGASGFWMIQDNKIYPINDGDTRSLAANDTATESTISGRGNEMDILSNGFKMRASTGDFNASNTHVYLAFAEQPFKFANAR